MRTLPSIAAALLAASLAPTARAQEVVRITEYMYTGNSSEFIEFTNVGTIPVTMTGWSYSDEADVAGQVDLSAFGVVLPGDSVLLIEGVAATFATDWGFDITTTVIIDNNGFNLNRNDKINLYKNQFLQDSLDFGDEQFPGTIRTNEISGNPCHEALGADDIFAWSLSAIGDGWGSTMSTSGDVGNPSIYTVVPCTPTEPGTAACFGDGSGAPCGCGNDSAPGSGGGCLNGLGVAAVLSASGSNSITTDDLVLTSSGVPAQPGLFFQGNNLIGGGTGQTFGDGLRCCGQNVVRIQVVVPPGPEPATASTSVSIANHAPPGTLNPGDTKCYQHWYRNPGSSPCGLNFNLSNGYSVTWAP